MSMLFCLWQINWSRTHEAQPKRLFQPSTLEELEAIVAYAHQTGRKLRPVGTFVSPNGIASSSDLMVSLLQMDAITHIDHQRQEVTVQAGIVVDTLLTELAKHGLTLNNFSSIKDQQMGGWTQVAAHGTGVTLSTVDEMIVSLQLVTPGLGTITLSQEHNPALFKLARVGLGALGVVSEMTLKCIPVHKLCEETYVVRGADQVAAKHSEVLQRYRHVRYMWVPGTDGCVIVGSNPVPNTHTLPSPSSSSSSNSDPTSALRALLIERLGEKQADETTGSFAQYRNDLLALDPLDFRWVNRVNQAELEFWENTAAHGQRLDWSENILGFDCGSPQWVFEVCFPTGSLAAPTGADLEFIKDLKQELLKEGLPAVSPIEQRWTSRSTSPMSPAFSRDENEIFSWVGGIMYMPLLSASQLSQARAGEDLEEKQRIAITKEFRRYIGIMNKLSDKYGATAHWAKLELPNKDLPPVEQNKQLQTMRKRLREKFPIAEFNQARGLLDPRHILSNQMITDLFD